MKANTRSVSRFAAALLACGFFSLSASAQAHISYMSGPNGCTSGSGYTDDPYCTIPNEIPLGGFAPPAVGQSYTDPTFGGTVTTLTPSGWFHVYSLPTPFSAHNKYGMVLRLTDGAVDVINPLNGQVLFPSLPWGYNIWDATNDDVYYYISGAQIWKHTLSNNQNTLVKDYSADGHGFTQIETGGSSDTSKDNWMSFWASNKNQVCAVNLNTTQTYCANYMDPAVVSQVGWGDLDYVMISKGVDSGSGKRYVMLMAAPALGMWSVDEANGVLHFETRGPADPEEYQNPVCEPGENCLGNPHADVFENSDGKQYMVTMKGYSSQVCNLQIVTMALSSGQLMYTPTQQGGGRNGFINMANCGEQWPAYHIGCAKQSPYCVIATHQNTLRDPGDLTTPFPTEPHRDEVMVMRGNGEEVRFLNITRSVPFTNDSYYAEPRAGISPDGSMVMFDSNFGVPGAERAMMVSTGFGGQQQQPPPPQNMAVTVNPSATTLTPGQAYQFSANVTGTNNQAVTWSFSPQNGALDASGYYVAPNAISQQQTVTVTATSVADPTKSGSASITLMPPGNTTTNNNNAVTVNPGTLTLGSGQGYQFSANVTGTNNQSVTWSYSPQVGIQYPGGFYLAPANISAQQTVTVTATSVADPTKSGSAVITLVPKGAGASVTANPSTTSLGPSQGAPSAATVAGA